MTYCWTTINVRDLEASLAFYRDLLGLPVKRRFAAGEGREIAFLGEGETQVELIAGNPGGQSRFGNDISLGFVVPRTLEDFQELLTARGIQVEAGPIQPNPQIRFSYIRDPDGLRIQLVENLA